MPFNLALQDINCAIEVVIVVKGHGKSVSLCIHPFNIVDLRFDHRLDLITRQQCEKKNADRPSTWVAILAAKRADLLKMWGVYRDLFDQHSASRRL